MIADVMAASVSGVEQQKATNEWGGLETVMSDKPPIWPVLERYGLDGVDPEGGRVKVLCPFHDESRPSASVDTDRQRFRCFACDIQGDAIDIIMLQESIDYPSAVEFLEENFGIERKKISSGSGARPRRSSLFVANRGSRSDAGNDRGVHARRRRPRLR